MIRLDGIALGASPPDDINVVVTAATGAEPLAVRVDELAGALVVSQLFGSAMRTPGNVGFIPHTLDDTGDPLGALLPIGHSLAPGMVVAARPIGVLYVTAEGGEETTVLAVPATRLTSRYERVANYTDLPAPQLRQIAHFFLHYRDLEDPGRPRSHGWGDVDEARRAITEAAARARRPLNLA